MPSAESPSDKIHSVAEVMPQRDSTEGTVDHLNEAPPHVLLELRLAVSGQLLCEDRFQEAEEVFQTAMAMLRDGQPR